MNYDNPNRAYIDLDAFRYNLQYVKDKYPGKTIILPIKANAYGHSAEIIGRCAADSGVTHFAVARVDEGAALRKFIPDNCRIIDLGVENGTNIDFAAENGVELSVSSILNVKEIEERAHRMGRRLPIHLNIDTGMGRLGSLPQSALETAREISRSDNLTLASVYTHFACSDESVEKTQTQIRIFKSIVELIKGEGINPPLVHLYNSGGVSNLSDDDLFNGMRPGMLVYGYPQDIGGANKYGFKPVMTLVSKVIDVKSVDAGTPVGYGQTFITDRETKLAVVPLGYGDGLFRALSNGFFVSINGRRYPQRGRISMDLTVIEVDGDVNPGDDVVIFGNKFYSYMNACDLADVAGTIPYEITTCINPGRVQRVAVKNIDELNLIKV